MSIWVATVRGGFPQRQAGALLQRPREGVVTLEWRNRFEDTGSDRKSDEVGGEGVVGDRCLVTQRRSQAEKVVRAEEWDAAAAEIDGSVECVLLDEGNETRPEVEVAFVDMDGESGDVRFG